MFRFSVRASQCPVMNHSRDNRFGVQPPGWGDESTLMREHPTLFIAFWVAQRAMSDSHENSFVVPPLAPLFGNTITYSGRCVCELGLAPAGPAPAHYPQVAGLAGLQPAHLLDTCFSAWKSGCSSPQPASSRALKGLQPSDRRCNHGSSLFEKPRGSALWPGWELSVHGLKPVSNGWAG